ncbi:hypothetical protein [Streptomyces sp. NPDC059262]|uniref:hypothetical protein n=1 Tax=Streptomyces sp. NPDC059262 TaxID=3346797 RepID=UPI0036CD4D84
MKHASSMLTPDSLMGSLHVFAHIVVTCVTTWQYVGALAVGIVLGLLARGPLSARAPGKNEALLAGARGMRARRLRLRVPNQTITFGKRMTSQSNLFE